MTGCISVRGKVWACDGSTVDTVLREDDWNSYFTSTTGTPSDDASVKVSGTNSYKIVLSSATLNFYHNYAGDTDWSSGLVQLYINASNTGTTFVIEYSNAQYATTMVNGYSYSLADSWSGWNTLKIGKNQFTSVGSPTGWDKIESVRVRSTSAVSTTYHFDLWRHQTCDERKVKEAMSSIPNGGVIEFGAGTFTFASYIQMGTIPTTYTFLGKGEDVTVLSSGFYDRLFQTISTSWDTNLRFFQAQDLTMQNENTEAGGIFDLDFWNILITRVRFSANVTNSGYIIRAGGSGAPTVPSSIVDTVFVNTGGLYYSWMVRLWYESCHCRNLTFVLTGGDIRGLMVLYGTEHVIDSVTIHSWSGRDIRFSDGGAAFWNNGTNCSVSINNIYYNYSGGTAPTYRLFRVTDSSNNVFRISGILRVAWEDPTPSLFYDATSEARTDLDVTL